MAPTATTRAQIMKLAAAYGPPDRTFIKTRHTPGGPIFTVRIKRPGGSRRFLVMVDEDDTPCRLEPLTRQGAKRVGCALRRHNRRQRDAPAEPADTSAA